MKVSVIIPVYNVEMYIEECIKSVQNQTLKDIEIIVVNDGSTDSSIRVIENIISDNENILLINKENGGLSSARNEGLKAAKGEYVAFIDSDDYIENDFLEILYNNAKKYNLDIACGGHSKIFNDRQINIERNNMLYETVSSGSEFLYRQFQLKDYRMEVWDDLYKREFLIKNNLSFYEGILHEDEEFTPKALIKANRVMAIKNFGYKYRQRNNSIMSTNMNINNINSLKYIIKNFIKLFNVENDMYSKAALSSVINHLIGVISIRTYMAGISYQNDIYKEIFTKELVDIVSYGNIFKNKVKVFILKKCPKLYISIIKFKSNSELK